MDDVLFLELQQLTAAQLAALLPEDLEMDAEPQAAARVAAQALAKAGLAGEAGAGKAGPGEAGTGGAPAEKGRRAGAATAAGKGKRPLRFARLGLVAGAALMVATAAWAALTLGHWRPFGSTTLPQPASSAAAPGGAALQGGTGTPPGGASQGAIPAGAGVFIPAVALPENVEPGTSFDMIALVVYRGGIYTAIQGLPCESEAAQQAWLGQHLGTATGTIDEWSTQADYATEFAGTMVGEVYTANGYDPAFRLAIPVSHQPDGIVGEDGAVSQPEMVYEVWFMERLNGIGLETGADLYDTRLKMPGQVAALRYTPKETWSDQHDPRTDHTRPLEGLADGEMDAFVEALCAAPFVGPLEDLLPHSPYLTLHCTLQDGSVVNLRLIRGGYVQYLGMGEYFLEMPGAVFDRMVAACGGF